MDNYSTASPSDIAMADEFISALDGLIPELIQLGVKNSAEYTHQLQEIFFACRSSFLSTPQSDSYEKRYLTRAFRKKIVGPSWEMSLLFDIGSFAKESNVLQLPIKTIDPKKINEIPLDFMYISPSLTWENLKEVAFPPLVVPFYLGDFCTLLIDGNHRLTAAINSKHSNFSMRVASDTRINRFIIGDFQKNYYIFLIRLCFWRHRQNHLGFPPTIIDLEHEFSFYFTGQKSS